MELVIEVDGYEPPLLAEMPETRQYFFLFSPDILFFTRSLARLPYYLWMRAKAHLLAERAKVCQYFFLDFLAHRESTRMIPIQIRRATKSHSYSYSCSFSATDCSDEIFRFVRCIEGGVCDAEGTSPRSHRLAELTLHFHGVKRCEVRVIRVAGFGRKGNNASEIAFAQPR
jgi:hypothetical protein